MPLICVRHYAGRKIMDVLVATIGQGLCHTLHINVTVCVTKYTYMSVSVSHITQVQQFWHPITLSPYLISHSCLGLGTLPRQLCLYPLPLALSPRQLSGPIVAREVARHRDTPKFCVRVIFDIYLATRCHTYTPIHITPGFTRDWYQGVD